MLSSVENTRLLFMETASVCTEQVQPDRKSDTGESSHFSKSADSQSFLTSKQTKINDFAR